MKTIVRKELRIRLVSLERNRLQRHATSMGDSDAQALRCDHEGPWRSEPRGICGGFDGPPQLPVVPLNVDLSTVTTAADLVFGLGEPLQEVIHIDCRRGPKADLPADLHAYNSLLYRRWQVPVHSIVLLLRTEAHHGKLTGTLGYPAQPGHGGTTFTYEVIKLSKRSIEHCLNGPLGIAPLAVLAPLPDDIALEQGLAGVIQRLCEAFAAGKAGREVWYTIDVGLCLDWLAGRPKNSLGAYFEEYKACRNPIPISPFSTRAN